MQTSVGTLHGQSDAQPGMHRRVVSRRREVENVGGVRQHKRNTFFFQACNHRFGLGRRSVEQQPHGGAVVNQHWVFPPNATTRPVATALRGPSKLRILPAPQTKPYSALAALIISGISKSSADPPSSTTNSSSRRLLPGATCSNARSALTTNTLRLAS